MTRAFLYILGALMLLTLISFVFIPYERGGLRQCLGNPQTGEIFCPSDPLLWFGQVRGVVLIVDSIILIGYAVRRRLDDDEAKDGHRP